MNRFQAAYWSTFFFVVLVEITQSFRIPRLLQNNGNDIHIPSNSLYTIVFFRS